VARFATLVVSSTSPSPSVLPLSPAPHRPSPNVAIFIDVIVKVPLVQIAALLIGVLLVLIEFPVWFIKNGPVYRSIFMRVVLLFMQAGLAALFYQGTNGALWSLIAFLAYSRAMFLGEQVVEEASARKGDV
jgi:hypothetical protein